MGCFGWISNLRITKRESLTEDARHLRRYEEQIAREPTNDDQSFRHKPNAVKAAWQWLIYDTRSRIFFGTLFAIFIGVGIPCIIYFADKPSPPAEIYGSCLLRQEFRIRCMVSNIADPTEDDCIDAKCCWNNNETLPFKCFHSLTPAYQYHVSSVQKSPGDQVEIDLRPNLVDRMNNLKVQIEWMNLEHLNVQIYDPAKHTPASIKNKPERRLHDEDSEFNRRAAELNSPEFNLTYATLNEYFYLHIVRNATGETIFDTRLGPLIAHDDYMSFVTGVPSPYFYGLKGGLSGGESINDNFNRFGPTDFPFYMAFESKSGLVHGVFLETTAPFITQYLEAPALMFHLEGSPVFLNLHFFVGPTVRSVYHQLYSYLNSKQDESTTPKMNMPPYWALGLHLCRTATEETDAFTNIQNISKTIHAYDSDCIDEDLRTPFSLDEARYPDEIRQITTHLQSKHQKILLVQKTVVSTSSPNVTSLLIMNSNKTALLIGQLDAKNSIYYPDYHASESATWLESEFSNLIPNELFGGLTMADNYPETFNATGICAYDSSKVLTRLEQAFVTSTILERRNQTLICPDSLHVSPATGVTKTHFEVQNIFGHESLVKIRNAFESSLELLPFGPERLVYASSSIWTSTFFSGGFMGPEVPFTWDGMIESLAYILRNFMFLPFSGTQICGSYLPENMDASDTDNLCFRWFQLGLLFPFARNSYRTDGTKGPLDLSAAYQDRINKNIRERYKYLPYYYTLFYEYETSEMPEPPIRPLLFDFPKSSSNVTFRILTQFMIGPALMAAPILTRSSQREAYFPPGTWYNLAGKEQWSNENEGGIRQLEGFVNELPIYLRSGFIIPILEEPIQEGRNAMESRAGNYSIVGTFPQDWAEDSNGALFMDDGVEVNSTGSNFDLLSFTMSNSSLSIEATCHLTDNVMISKLINQVKIFGFPERVDRVSVNINEAFYRELVEEDGLHYDDEYKVLYFKDLNLQWCIDFQEVSFEWSLPVD